jgi:hypothetical protein
MIENLPSSIALFFGLIVLLTLALVYWTIKNSAAAATNKKALIIASGLFVWIIIQSVFTLQNIYDSDANTFPPKIMLLGILPTFLGIIIILSTNTGKQFVDSFPLRKLTYLHIIRIPVEIVLFLLFTHKAIPELMTFEGRNFDVISGITAPIVAYFGFANLNPNKNLLLLWNIICLIIVINIVVLGLLSVQTPIQQFAFDQPNIAVLKFPFSLLPTFIVPVVILAHLISIRQLLKTK